jgi:2-hydroxy-3-oxopropionate reductase
MTAADSTVGFVGLGAMGARMAARLLDAGHTLVVHDTSTAATERIVARGALAAPSPRVVADAASTVFVSLPNAAIVRAVALGEDGIRGGSAVRTYVDVSTTGPQASEEIAAELAREGVASVDAPVSGGPAGAESGRLAIMIAGPEAAVAQVRPLLEILGAKLFVVGDRPGQGQMVKVINNLMSAASIAITAEATVLGTKAGLDPATVLEVVAASSGANTAAGDKFPKQVLTRNFAHGFRLELMAKDVGLCLEEARRHGVPMLLGSTVDELWRLADEHDGADCTSYVRMIENWAGAVIQSPAVPTTDKEAR